VQVLSSEVSEAEGSCVGGCLLRLSKKGIGGARMHKNKAQGMSMDVIIIAALALLVLVILAVIFIGKMGQPYEPLTDEELVECFVEHDWDYEPCIDDCWNADCRERRIDIWEANQRFDIGEVYNNTALWACHDGCLNSDWFAYGRKNRTGPSLMYDNCSAECWKQHDSQR